MPTFHTKKIKANLLVDDVHTQDTESIKLLDGARATILVEGALRHPAHSHIKRTVSREIPSPAHVHCSLLSIYTVPKKMIFRFIT